MKTFSRLPPLPRPHGGALRVLVLCLGVLSLAVIGWLMGLPKNLQEGRGVVCLAALALLWGIVAIAWMMTRQRSSSPGFSFGRVFAVLGLLGILFAVLVGGSGNSKNGRFVADAKRYVWDRAKDPSSVVFNSVSHGETDSQVVIVLDWTGTNSFGGKARLRWRFGFQKPNGPLTQIMDESTGKMVE